MTLPRAPDSVLRVESEQDAQHAEKVNERRGNQIANQIAEKLPAAYKT